MTATREPLSKVDTAWLHMESPTNPMMPTSVLLFDEAVDLDRYRHLLNVRLLRFERFRQRVVTPLRNLRAPQWEIDPGFDLDHHVHHVALPSPGGDAELQELVGDLMSTPLDLSRPLWQVHVVDGYGEGGAVVTRIHHCVADGVALIGVLLSLSDEEPDAPLDGDLHMWDMASTSEPPQVRGVVGTARHLAAAGIREGLRTVVNPMHGIELARAGYDNLTALVRVSTLPTEPPTSLKGPLSGRKRPAWSDPIPVSEVKAIGREVDATVNDVLVSTATGALRRYMLEHGDELDGGEIHLTVPVNLRRPDVDPDLGNRFGLIYPALPIGVADPLRRLRAVKERIDTIKATAEANVAIRVLDVFGRSPHAVEQAALDLFTSKSSAVMTNVMGPRGVRYVAGNPLRRILVWAPPSGSLAMSVSIFSYNGSVTVGIATDAAVIPHPEAIVAAFHEELAALAAAAGRRDSARAARRVSAQSRRARGLRPTSPASRRGRPARRETPAPSR